jgi:hypothetical protein
MSPAPRSGAYQIWKMPAQGGEAAQLTHRGGFAAFESLDGRSIYYTKAMKVKKDGNERWESSP